MSDPNPNAGKFVLPAGYRDLGRNIDPQHADLTWCAIQGHAPRWFDNSALMFTGTDRVWICDQCRYVHHVDESV